MSIDRTILRAADDLRQAVRKSELSQREIAERAEVHPVTLSRWLSKSPGGYLSPAKMDDVAGAIGKKFRAHVELE